MQDNPMGTDGFEFVEFSTTNETILSTLFTTLGFQLTAKHKDKKINIYQQGNINFILNAEANSFASKFSTLHGPAACGMAFKVKNANTAIEHALKLGAKAYTENSPFGELKIIYGIGESLLYLVDDKSYQDNFTFFESKATNDAKLDFIDHLTHNVYQGKMQEWTDFYEKIFNFKKIRTFDIQGKKTGLVSYALSSPCDKIKIPINESKDNKSQIAEYLEEYKGEGIQHIALSTNDMYSTVEKLRSNGMEFMDTPDTYYEMIDTRVPEHKEDLKRMKKNNILIDGGEKQGGGLLLQIFTKTVIGPIFFEIIQRKGNEGFGEGNFQALFDSIELDQVRRGVLT